MIGTVVLYYDRGPDVLGTLETLLGQADGVGPIVLFDNASPTVPAATLGALPPEVTLVRSEENLGYAAGMNAAVAGLPPDLTHVLLLTHDVRLDDGCVAALRAALDADERIGVVSPLVNRHSATDRIYSGGGEYRGRAKRPAHRRTPKLLAEWPRDEVRSAEWLDGCTLMIRPAALAAVGGFDPAFFLYVEDADLCERMRTAGWKVCVATGARVWEESAGTDSASYLANRLELHRRHHGRRTVAHAVAAEGWIAAKQLVVGRPGGRASGRTRVREIAAFLRGRGAASGAPQRRAA